MSTRLYLHEATHATLDGVIDVTGAYMPLDAFANLTSQETNTRVRQMDTTIGTGQVAVTQYAPTSEWYINYRLFASNPLSANASIGGTVVYCNYAAMSPLANYGLVQPDNISMAIYRPSTNTMVGRIAVTAVNNYQVPNATNTEKVMHLQLTATAISALVGDVILMAMGINHCMNSSNLSPFKLYYDGATVNTTRNATVSDHASFLEFYENLTFLPPASVGSSVGTAGGSVKGSTLSKSIASVAGTTAGQVYIKSLTNAVASSVGTATANAGGTIPSVVPFSGVGTSTVQATGVQAGVGVGSSAGVVAGTVVGKMLTNGIGQIVGGQPPGIGSAVASGIALKPAIASAVGQAVTSWETAKDTGYAYSAGSVSASVEGSSLVKSQASVVAGVVANSIGAGNFNGLGRIVCNANLNGVGKSIKDASGAASSNIVVGFVGIAASITDAHSSGLASVAATSTATAKSVGNSDGQATINGAITALGKWLSVMESFGLASSNVSGSCLGDGVAKSESYVTIGARAKQIGWGKTSHERKHWIPEAREI